MVNEAEQLLHVYHYLQVKLSNTLILYDRRKPTMAGLFFVLNRQLDGTLTSNWTD